MNNDKRLNEHCKRERTKVQEIKVEVEERKIGDSGGRRMKRRETFFFSVGKSQYKKKPIKRTTTTKNMEI